MTTNKTTQPTTTTTTAGAINPVVAAAKAANAAKRAAANAAKAAAAKAAAKLANKPTTIVNSAAAAVNALNTIGTAESNAIAAAAVVTPTNMEVDNEKLAVVTFDEVKQVVKFADTNVINVLNRDGSVDLQPQRVYCMKYNKQQELGAVLEVDGRIKSYADAFKHIVRCLIALEHAKNYTLRVFVINKRGLNIKKTKADEEKQRQDDVKAVWAAKAADIRKQAKELDARAVAAVADKLSQIGGAQVVFVTDKNGMPIEKSIRQFGMRQVDTINALIRGYVADADIAAGRKKDINFAAPDTAAAVASIVKAAEDCAAVRREFQIGLAKVLTALKA